VVDLSIDGADWLSSLDEREREIHRKGERVVRAYTLKGEALSKQFAPVRTGALRSSIHSDFDVSGDHISGTWRSDLEYSHWVERGTSRMAPRPYIAPAFQTVKPLFEAAVASLLE
jgi:HK97 gp10 family phage protein